MSGLQGVFITTLKVDCLHIATVAYAGFFNGGVSVTSHRDDAKHPIDQILSLCMGEMA